MGGKKPLRRPLWPPTRATASNYYPLGLDGAGGAAKPLLRAPKKPAPLHGRLPAFSGAVDAFERARKCFLEWRYFFSIILSEFLKNRVALQSVYEGTIYQYNYNNVISCARIASCYAGVFICLHLGTICPKAASPGCRSPPFLCSVHPPTNEPNGGNTNDDHQSEGLLRLVHP